MVSLACEQWPDTVIPVTEELEPAKNEPTVLTVEPKHLFDAWEQSCLELAKIPCQVVCQFGSTALQRTLLYGSRVMPLRIFENVHKCNVRGFIKNVDTLDVICTDSDTFNGNNTGWRVFPKQIQSIEIRTQVGTMKIFIKASDKPSNKYWIMQPEADELSCWVWSVSSKEYRRANSDYILDSLQNSGVITDKMINILK